MWKKCTSSNHNIIQLDTTIINTSNNIRRQNIHTLGMENTHCRISTANNKEIFSIHVPSIEILTAMHVFSFEPFKPFNPGHIPFTILPRHNDHKLRDINLISIWCYVPDNKPPFATVMIKMCRFDIPVMFSLWLRFTMTRGRKSTLWLRFFYNQGQTFGIVPICLGFKPEAKWGEEPLSNLLPVLVNIEMILFVLVLIWKDPKMNLP